MWNKLLDTAYKQLWDVYSLVALKLFFHWTKHTSGEMTQSYWYFELFLFTSLHTTLDTGKS